MTNSARSSDRAEVTLRWEHGLGLCIRTRLPGDVVSEIPVKWWRTIPAWISEARWVYNGLRSGEIER